MNENSALIGFTGFVGSTLLRSRSFDALYNSTNIDEIRRRDFSRVVCAGISAVKWWANKNPLEDKAAIDRLKRNVDAVRADRFILVSTVDVYPHPVGVTERDVPDHEASQPYGRHRREFEIWASERFDDCTIVRLPGLFGPGLKKNLIYDLMNDNQTTSISPNSVLQWYPMERFADDLDKVVAAGVRLINIAPDPLATLDIKRRFFPDAELASADAPGPSYDMRTINASLLGGMGDYHLSRSEILDEMGQFIAGASNA